MALNNMHQCWLNIGNLLWHSSQANIAWYTQNINKYQLCTKFRHLTAQPRLKRDNALIISKSVCKNFVIVVVYAASCYIDARYEGHECIHLRGNVSLSSYCCQDKMVADTRIFYGKERGLACFQWKFAYIISKEPRGRWTCLIKK